jgi:Homeodomain-like domain-containing protein
MHSPSTVRAALALAERGENATDIARRLAVPRRTVSDWVRGSVPRTAVPGGRAQGDEFADLPPAYVYLFGLYLGDGCIATHPRGVYRIRFSLDTRYPQIIAECVGAISAVMPANRVGQVSHGTWVEVYCYSKAWSRLFPQHGPGKKHERRIALVDWQEELVDRWPEQLLRGLIHSDGCRFQNSGTNWSWPRYAFNQLSDDIREIFCQTCDRLGVHWTRAKNTIYVSRKADVATLDEFIGPKQ